MPYLNRITNLKFGGAVFTGTTDELNTVAGVVPGIVSSGSALIVNSVNDLTGVNIMTANGYYGSVLTPTQTAITNVGTLLGLSVIGTTTTDTLTATNINGVILTASQPNITTIGSLTGLTLTGAIKSQYSSNGTDGNNVGMMGQFINNTNASSYLELKNFSGTTFRIGCDGSGLLNVNDTNHVAIGNYTNGDLKLYTNANEKMRIKSSGFIGMGTLVPNKSLSINSTTGGCIRLIYNNSLGTETVYTDLITNTSGNYYIQPSGVSTYIKSNLVIGNDANSSNIIYFNGVTSDVGENITVIAERIYSGGVKSELLLFKGSDVDNIEGPDRIRLRSAEFRLQTYTSAEDYSTLLDNNDRLVIINSGLVGIGTSVPNKQLSINSTTGNCLRLIYNNSSGAEGIYSDFNVDSNGNLILTPTGSQIYTSKQIVIQTTSGDGLSHLSPNGLSQFLTRVTNTYTQIGNNTNNILYLMTNNVNRMIINASGFIGVGTNVPNKKLSISDIGGNCLRLIYGNTVGTESVYADINITISGNLSLSTTGTYITTQNRVQIINNGYGLSHLSGLGVELSTYTSGNLYGFIGTISSHPLHLGTGNTERITIDSNGLIGINTTNPLYRLHITTTNNNKYGMVHTDGIFKIGTYLTTVNVGFGTISTHDLTLFANNGLVKMTLATSGNLGVNTTLPNKKVSINSSTGDCLRLIYNNSIGTETIYSDINVYSNGDLAVTPSGLTTYIKSGLTVGRNAAGPNIIQFNGTTADNTYTTLLMERIYSESKSELLIFKGKDTSGTLGPDRVRFRSAEFRFQILTSSETGALNSIGTISDNNNKLIIANTGFIGINTTVPNRQVSINSITGNCLRLVYNDSTGFDSSHVNLNVTSSGALELQSVGSSTGFIFTGGNIFGTLASGPQLNITQLGTLSSLTVSGILSAGTFNASNLGGVLTTTTQPNIISVGNYLLIGSSTDSTRMISALKTTVGVGQTLSFTLGQSNTTLNQAVYSYTHIANGSTNNYISLGFTNQKILNIFGNKKIGINTLVPNKQLSISEDSGQCIRIIYSNSLGTETVYSDYGITALGNVTFTAAGTAPRFTFTGGNLFATIGTPSQPNITQVGILSSLNVTNGITAGTVSASSLSGTILTPIQPNITSLGTLTNLTVSGTLVVGTFSAGAVASVIQTPGQPFITSLGTLTSLNMSGPITGATTITSGNYIGTISTPAQPNITSIGTLTNLTVSSTINTNIISATSIIGTISSPTQLNITQVGTLSSLKIGTGKVSINTTSVAKQVNINNSIGDCLRLIYNNSIGTETNYVDIAVSSSGALVFTASGTSPSFNFYGGGIIGNIKTAAQPNITSLGILTSLTVSGSLSAGSFNASNLGGVLSTSTQPNITSVGTLTGLIVAGTISGVTTITASSIVGAITTASQPNITSLGTLNGLKVGSNVVSINTISQTKQVNINSPTGSCLRIIYNNNLGTETTFSEYTISSSGIVTFRAVGTSPGFLFTGGNVAATISTASQPNITSLGILSTLTLAGPISGVTTLTANNINGTILTASQPNITSIGTLTSLTVDGEILSSYSSTTGELAYLQNTNTTVGGYIEVTNNISTRALFGVDGTQLTNGSTSSVVLGNFSNGDLKLYTNSIEQFRIKSTGEIGINTISPSSQLSINSSSGDFLRLIYDDNIGTETIYVNFTGDFAGNLTISPTGDYSYIESDIVVGAYVDGPNNIHFSGTTGDLDIYNTVISEAVYDISDGKSELFLFKGNDSVAGGPDRIRYRSAEHRFQTFTTATEDYNSANDNNNRLIIKTSGLIGINTTNPNKQLSINNSSGNCLRLIFNNSIGTETTYCDTSISSSGVVTFNAVGTSPGFTFSGGNISGIIQTASQPNITSVGTLSSLTITGALSAGSFSAVNLGGTLSTTSQPNITSVGTLTNLNVAGTLTAGSFNVANLGGTLTTAAQPNITSVGTLGYLNISGHLTAGSFTIANLSGTNISGTLTTAAQPNITSVGTLTGLYVAGTLTADFFDIGEVSATISTPAQPVITSLGTQLFLDISGITTSTNTTASTSNITGSFKLAGGIGISNTTDAVDSTNGGTFTSAGGGAFAKKLYVGTTLTAASLAGTIITAAQPNITSLGTLTSLNISGSITGVTSMSLTTLTATNVSGTLTTAAQPNITSLGIISSLRTNTSPVGINTSGPNKQLEINNLTGDCLRLTHNDITGNAPYYTDFNVSSAGILTIKPSGTSVALFTNKNLVLSGTGSISGVSTLTATNISGTLNTAAQANITSVGTLTSITTSGIINSTLNTASLNSTTGALTFAGGISISNTTDATSDTIGGTFTSAGGGAFAKSLYVGQNLIVAGDLTIDGITTTINSTVIEIADNILLLNNGPIGTGYDSGFMVARFQEDNDSGTGNIVNDSIGLSINIITATIDTIELAASASSVNGFYTNMWIKITTGNAPNRVRQIIDYDGTTKVATMSSVFDIIPIGGSSVNIYDNVYSNFIWQASNKRFLAAYTSSSSNSTSLSITNNADLAFEKGYALSTDSSTSNSTGSLILVGGIGISNTTDATNSTNGGTFTSAGGGAFAKSLHVGTTLTASSLAGTIITAAQPNITSVGTLTSLVLSGSITGATDISGTLTTAAQPNITSVGTLTSLTLSGTLSGITTLTATNIGGTLTTAAQPNITSVGTLTSLSLSGTVSGITTLTATTLAGTLSTAAQPNITSVGTLTSLVLSGTVSGVTTLTATSLAGTLTTTAQPNITSVGTLTSLTTGTGSVGINTSLPSRQMEVNSSTGNCLRLTYNNNNGTATNYLDFSVGNSGISNITPVGISAAVIFNGRTFIDHDDNEAILVRKNNNAGDIFSVDSINEFVNIIQHNGISKGLRLGGILVTSTAAELNILDGVTSTTAELNILDGVTSTTAELNILDGVTSTTTELNLLDGVTASTLELNFVDVVPGIATASKALVLDGSKDIATINSLTATSITGTLQTSAQTNITSLGTLNGVSVNGSASIGNLSGGSRIRYVESGGIMYFQTGSDGNTGSAADLFIGNYFETITVSARKNMFKADGKVGFGTYAPDKQLEINSATGDCLRLTYNDSTGGASIYSDFAVSPSGVLTMTPSGTSITLAANKNLVLSGTGSISGVATLTATNLSGTIITAAQTNITSVGILSGLTTGTGLVGINTTGAERQLEINSSIGECLRLTHNDPNGGASHYSDMNISATGELTIAPTGAYVAFTKKLQIVNDGVAISFRSGIGVEYRVVVNANLDASVGTFSNHHYHLVSNSLIRLTVHNNSNIGIGTEVPNKRVSISDTTGGALRLIYNNTIGTETIYSDYSIASTGLITFAANGGASPGFAFTGGNVAATLSTASQPNITSLGTLTSLALSGTISGVTTLTATNIVGTLTTTSQPNIISLGTLSNLTISNNGGTSLIINSTTATSTSHIKYNTNGDNWEFGAYGSTNSTAPNAMYWYNTSTKMVLLNSGKLGIGTTAPDQQLEINSSTGECLRLTHNDPNGTATNYCDFLMTGVGSLRIKPSNNKTIFDGVVQAANGLVSTPSYSFENDINSGMYSGGTDILKFSTAGLDRLTISEIGRVGIGNTIPSNTLHVTNGGYAQLRLQTTSDISGATMVFQKPNEPDFSMGIQTNRFYIYDNSTYRLTINTLNENIGINTNTPSKALEINSVTGNCLRLTYSDSNSFYSDFDVSATGNLTITPSGGDTTISGNLNATLTTSAQPNITSLGALSGLSVIASGSPTINVESTNIASAFSGVRLNTVGNDWLIGAYNANNSGSPNSFFIYDNTATLSRVTITPAGFVGIGTNIADKQLEINSVTGECLRLTHNDSNGGAANYVDFSLNGIGDLTITPSGNDTTITGSLTVGSLNTPVLNVTGISTNFAEGGLIMNSYSAEELNGKLIQQELITDINLTDYNPTGLTNNYSTEIIGFIKPQYSETYTFHITFDDGVRLWVNDILLFQDWSNGSDIDISSNTIALTAGEWYPIRIHHNENIGNQRLLLQWSSISETKANIPSIRMAWDNTNNHIHINPSFIPDSLTLYNSTTDLANIASLAINSLGDLLISTNSINRMVVNSTGNIGIGTTSPDSKLHIIDTTSDPANTLCKLQGTGSVGDGITLDFENSALSNITGRINNYKYADNDYGLIFSNFNSSLTEHMVLRNGRVGIGTNNPDKQLEINSINGNCLRLTHNDSNGTATNYADLAVTSLGNLVITSSNNYIDLLSRTLIDIAGSNIAFQVNGGSAIDTVFNVSTANNAVGINTTSIDKSLEINSVTGNCLRLTHNDPNGTATNYADLDISNVGYLTITPTGGYTYVDSNLFVRNSATAAFQIDNASNNILLRANTLNSTVGINTTVADKALEVNSTTGACLRLTYNDNNGSASFYSDFSISPAGNLTIAPSGGDVTITNNLGLNGTTLPIAAIDMGPNASNRSLLLFNNTDIFGFGANNGLLKYQSGTNGGHAFYTNATPVSTGTELMRLTTSGNLGIGTTTPNAKLEITSTVPEIRLTDDRVIVPQVAGTELGNLSFYSTDGSLTGSYGAIAKISAHHDNTTVAPDGRIVFSTAINGVLTNHMAISSGGNVGIGVVNPTSPLTIDSIQDRLQLLTCSTAAIGAYIDIRNKSTTARLLLGAGGSGTGSAITDVLIGNWSNGGMDIRTNSTNRMYINSTGQIGIGTTAPDRQLEINSLTGQCVRLTYNDSNGSAANYTDLAINSDGRMIITASGGKVGIHSSNVGVYSVAKEPTLQIMQEDDYNGIGDVALGDFTAIRMGVNKGNKNDDVISSYTMDIDYNQDRFSPSKLIFKSMAGAVGAETGLSFETTKSVNWAVNSIMTLWGNNVGIGTTSPAQLLHLSSATDAFIKLDADTGNTNEGNNAGILLTQDSGITTGGMQLEGIVDTVATGSLANALIIDSNNQIQLATSGVVALTITSAGRIGIGKTNPSSGLHVVHNTIVSSKFENTTVGAGSYIEINNQAGTRCLLGPDGVNYSGGSTLNVLLSNWSNGNLNFATNAIIRASLDTSGDFSAVTLTETSDKRLKENIISVDNQESYNKIKQLEVVDYNFISDEQKKKHRGLIAQDLLNVIPTAVHIKSGTTIDGLEDLHTVSNKEIMGHLLSAFQHLTQKVEKLEEENKILKQKVEQLENK